MCQTLCKTSGLEWNLKPDLCPKKILTKTTQSIQDLKKTAVLTRMASAEPSNQIKDQLLKFTNYSSL